jgi:hypothetical protein
MQAGKNVFTQKRPSAWTGERIGQLDRNEIEQLRANAMSLGEQVVVALCDEALTVLPKAGGKDARVPAGLAKARRLISRGKAFEARGVYLVDPRSSWSGVRKSDGMVVMSLWADAIKLRDGACNYLLWAPNSNGARPWSDSVAGRERLAHCRLVAEGKTSEGLLVYGEALAGHIPEDKARSVHGVDPEAVLHFTVEKHGEEYWAVWGRKASAAAGASQAEHEKHAGDDGRAPHHGGIAQVAGRIEPRDPARKP